MQVVQVQPVYFCVKTSCVVSGPTEKTVLTFWKMIWEHKSSVIVMLTNLKEKDKVKNLHAKPKEN